MTITMQGCLVYVRHCAKHVTVFYPLLFKIIQRSRCIIISVLEMRKQRGDW